MAYTQLIKPDLTTQGAVGMCLNYARRVFSIDSKYLTAWKSWENSDQHKDRNYPKGVAVPLWFSYYIGSENYGHVVIAVPGKGLYSSPYKSSQTHAVLSSIFEVERIYGVKYAGWSTEINDVKVAKPDTIKDVNKFTASQVNTLIAAVFNRQATKYERTEYPKKSADWVLETVYNNSAGQRSKASGYNKLKASLAGLKDRIIQAVKRA